MTDYNLTVSEYKKIHAKREAEIRNAIRKEYGDHEDNLMVTIIDEDTYIINY